VLAALACVDWVVSFGEDTPAKLIEQLSPDVLVKGGDYKPKDIAGADHVLAKGGEVKVLQYVDGCSTSRIIENIRQLEERKR
jgi:D-beta-D-heptose 7-phosphate kinase/D-beta-D-heptose 1-phosphate adenosyltransferase